MNTDITKPTHSTDVIETHKVKDKGNVVEETKKTTVYETNAVRDLSKDKDHKLKKEAKDKDTIATYKETNDKHHTGHHMGSHHDSDKVRGSWNDLSYPANTINPNTAQNPYISTGYNPNYQQPYGAPGYVNTSHYGYNQHPNMYPNNQAYPYNSGFVGGPNMYGPVHGQSHHDPNRPYNPVMNSSYPRNDEYYSRHPKNYDRHHGSHSKHSGDHDRHHVTDHRDRHHITDHHDRHHITGSHVNSTYGSNVHPNDYNRGYNTSYDPNVNTSVGHQYDYNRGYNRHDDPRTFGDRAKDAFGIGRSDNRNYTQYNDYNRNYDSRGYHPNQTDLNRNTNYRNY